jgi:hypothetical protein
LDVNVYSARYEADNRKRSRTHTNSEYEPTAKRVRNPDRRCENPNCNSPIGHYKTSCYAYGGGKCGKYPPWWPGPWNIHLAPSERDRIPANVRPSQHTGGQITANQTSLSDRIEPAPAISHTLSERISSQEDSRSNYGTGSDAPTGGYRIHHVDATSSPIFNETLQATILDNSLDEDLVCNASALGNGPVSQECIHDSAANRHVFHSRSLFSEYEEIDPVRVKGFGKELSTAAVGKGTVLVRARFRDGPWRLFDLKNCLHIPSARFNLISQPQLDHHGVEARSFGGNVYLSKNGDDIVSGSLGHDDMYRLQMEPVPMDPSSLPNDLVEVFQTHVGSGESLEDFITA